ncbi:MAG: hypothetical protein WCF17_04850 [Terracidiphilus sp.]
MRPRKRRFPFALVCIAVLLACGAHARAQQRPPEVQALLVSDVHFEPFWDPGKAAKLAASPVSGWRSILESPLSPDRQQQFSDLEKSCHVRGDDTSFPLFESALQAMRTRGGAARFVTVSGDLIAHDLDCKYKSLFPEATPQDRRAFVEKTIAFVAGELDRVASPAPVYVALGNNDSDCGDYRSDQDGLFLADIGPLLLRGVSKREGAEVMESFKKGGYYSVILPAPLEPTRLVVLNDVLLSPWHQNCAGKPDPAAGDAELDWLARQLARARAAGENVWVMGHIPPGVDAYATLARPGPRCNGKPPAMFLATDKLAQELTRAGDEIRLAIFAHAHTDEFKLLQAELANAAPGAAKPSGPQAIGSAVAIKMVPSISPINGNNPAFIVAQVDPSTARLDDYRVYAAKNPAGAGAWPELYDFDRAFNQKSFSPGAVESVLAEFSADPGAKSAASRDYVKDFLTGRPDMLLLLVWPQYVCTLSQATASAYSACACSALEPVPGNR